MSIPKVSCSTYPPSSPLRTPLIRGHTVSYSQEAGKKRPLLSGEEQMMAKKFKEAVSDHQLSLDKLPFHEPKRKALHVALKSEWSSHKGTRKVNEDAHVIVQTEYGDIFAICDGHGLIDPVRLKENQPQVGEEIAELVAQSVKKDLPALIKEYNFNTKLAFEKWAEKVHNAIPKVIGGTTAVIGFYEKINGFFHVATIGDSEAVVFRKKNDKIYPLPMSTKLNWATPAYEHIVQKMVEPKEFEEWIQLPTKFRRFPPRNGLNLANSLGDKMMEYKGQSAITHQPECTLLQLEQGDLIMLGCDGVFDFTGLEELIDEILEPHWDNPKADLSNLIAQYALHTKKSTDNVTVITARVNPKAEQIEITASQSTEETPTEPSSPN